MCEIKEGLDYYLDNFGRLVFTEHYHLQRGYCCGNGCRHCPYNYINVPQPGREILIKKRKAAHSSNDNKGR